VKYLEIRVLIVVVLFAVTASCDRTITATSQGEAGITCFLCHGNGDTILVAAKQQWLNSRHASGKNIHNSDDPCGRCHTHEGFIRSVASGGAPGNADNSTAIHCFTCHAPHTYGDYRLRYSDEVVLENGETADFDEGNICAACHRARHNVDTYVSTPNDTVVFDSSDWGPHHGTQSDVLIGSNGYEYWPAYYPDGPHLDAAGNGCLRCHSNIPRNTRLGGHSFNMRWEDGGEETINTGACNQGGCHNGFEDFDHDDIQTDVDALLATLKTLLVDAGLIDESDRAIPGRVVASSDTAGAVWNYLMALGDGSRGVHNPEYVPDLLGTSIIFMGGTPPVSVADRISRTGPRYRPNQDATRDPSE
jgi:hypothetical protein